MGSKRQRSFNTESILALVLSKRHRLCLTPQLECLTSAQLLVRSLLLPASAEMPRQVSDKDKMGYTLLLL